MIAEFIQAFSQANVLEERLIVVFAVPWCAVPCRGEVWASGGETTHQATHPGRFLPFPVPLTCPDAPQTTTVHQPWPNPLQVTQARARAALSRQNQGREGKGGRTSQTRPTASSNKTPLPKTLF